MTFVLVWLLCGVIAARIGAKKGEGRAGFLAGITLGPFGILIALLMKGHGKTCPHCRELVDQEATVCPFCRQQLEFSVFAPSNPTQRELAAIIGSWDSPAPKPAVTQPAGAEPEADDTVACPSCGEPLKISTLKPGENSCPHCFAEFDAE